MENFEHLVSIMDREETLVLSREKDITDLVLQEFFIEREIDHLKQYLKRTNLFIIDACATLFSRLWGYNFDFVYAREVNKPFEVKKVDFLKYFGEEYESE
jgi:hypothetical protein